MIYTLIIVRADDGTPPTVEVLMTSSVVESLESFKDNLVKGFVKDGWNLRDDDDNLNKSILDYGSEWVLVEIKKVVVK